MLNIAVEEVAHACASSALMLMIQELGTLPIKLFGTEELKQRLLPRCAAGEWTPAFALSEPDAGSDPGGMRTRAVRDGDEWVIDGAKNWITNLGVANFYVVFCVTDPDAGRSRGISAFVVEADRPGFSVGKLEHKMGIRGSPTGQPIFDGVRVPAENLIGEENQGFKVAMETLDRSRLGRRRPGGRDRPGRHRLRGGLRLGAPTVRQADRLVSGNPVQAGRDGDPHGCRAGAPVPRLREGRRGEPDIGKYSAMAKLFASDTAMWVTTEAVQVLGGYGYVSEYPVERMMRDAKITQIYEGTNEIQRLVIARTL